MNVNKSAYNLLIGNYIGEGEYRTVYECCLRDDLVAKIEKPEKRHAFANVHEFSIWQEYKEIEAVRMWLAPIYIMSDCAQILLQSKVSSVPVDFVWPDKLPSFLGDIKRENFGWFENRLVCIDYANTVFKANTRMKAVKWD